MKDEASRIYGYTFISKAISKFRLSTKVYIIICHDRAARVDANPYSTLFKACCCPGEGGGEDFRNFWVGMCRWDPRTLKLYQC